MKNKISRISPERKMEIKELIEQIRQESYEQGYEDGKAFVPVETVEDNTIIHDSKSFRKVNRKAREGDIVIFQKSNEHFESDKPYPVETDVKFKDEDGDYQNVYNRFNRRENYVNVYELIKQEISANQQRAELIEKAKEFVKVKSEYVKDSTKVVGGWERKKYENPNYCDFQMNVVFEVNENKRTVVALCKYSSGEVKTKGIAKCHPNEVFHAEIGKAIALAKALQIDIPVEFLEAVQPTGFAVGQVVKYVSGFFSNETRVISSLVNNRVDYSNGKWFRLDWEDQAPVIIDDTNAQYEVGE